MIQNSLTSILQILTHIDTHNSLTSILQILTHINTHFPLTCTSANLEAQPSKKHQTLDFQLQPTRNISSLLMLGWGSGSSAAIFDPLHWWLVVICKMTPFLKVG